MSEPGKGVESALVPGALSPAPTRSTSAESQVAEDDAVANGSAAKKELLDGNIIGKTRWVYLRVLAANLLFVSTWGPAISFGAFEAYYQYEGLPQYSASSIAWIGGMSTFLLVASGIFTGPLYDRGLIRVMLFGGAVLLVFGMMMTSLATEYYQIFLAQGIAFGLGCGLVVVPALSFVSDSFPAEKRAIAVGLTAVGASIGGIIFPIVFRKLQPQLGFGWTVRIIAFVQLGLCAISLTLVANAPRKKTKPRSMFQLEAFTELPYGCFTVACFCQFLAYWIPLFYVTTYARSVIHMSDDLAFYCVSVLNAGSVFGRILPMFIMRRTGTMPVVFVSTWCAVILLWSWIAVKNTAGFLVFCALFGAATGTFISANPVAITHPAMIPSMDVIGARLGMNYGLGGVGTLIGTPIAGALARPAQGDFLRAQAFAASIMTVAGLLMTVPLIATVRHDRRAQKKTVSK